VASIRPAGRALPATARSASRSRACFGLLFHLIRALSNLNASLYIAYFGGCYLTNINRAELCSPVGQGDLPVGNFSRPGSASCWGGLCRSLAAVWQPASATAAAARWKPGVDYPKRNARPGLCRPSANARASRRFAEAEHGPALSVGPEFASESGWLVAIFESLPARLCVSQPHQRPG
jgi:hypothetical protein